MQVLFNSIFVNAKFDASLITNLNPEFVESLFVNTSHNKKNCTQRNRIGDF